MDSPAAAQLAALFPADREVTIAGRSITLSACTLGQAGRIVDSGAELYTKHLAGESFEDLFDRYPVETSDLLVAATGLEREWVTGLANDERYELASHWLAMNADFFVRRRLPSLARTRGAIASIGAGATSTTTSSEPDTPTPPTSPSAPAPSSSKRHRAANAESVESA